VLSRAEEEYADAWLAALLVDDEHAVGGVHDRLVPLVPVDPVVLMPGLAEDLIDPPPTGWLTVDTTSFNPITDVRCGWCVLRVHMSD
jgi:hypothetical protein